MVMHHKHTGGAAGPQLRADDFMEEGTLVQAMGKQGVDAARVDRSYAENCFVDPTAGWRAPAQSLGFTAALESRVDLSYANACAIGEPAPVGLIEQLAGLLLRTARVGESYVDIFCFAG